MSSQENDTKHNVNSNIDSSHGGHEKNDVQVYG